MALFCMYLSNEFSNPFLLLVSTGPGSEFHNWIRHCLKKSCLHKGRDKVILNFICRWHQSELQSFLNLCEEVQVVPGQRLVCGRVRLPKGPTKDLLVSPGPSIFIRHSLSLKSPEFWVNMCLLWPSQRTALSALFSFPITTGFLLNLFHPLI